jgi:hypothetical protein
VNSARLLSRRELAASGVVDAEEAGCRVNDDALVAVLYQQRGRVPEQLDLVLRSVSADIGHIVQHRVRIKAVALSDGLEPFRSKRTLGVNDKHLAVRPALLRGQLGSDSQCVRQLTFAGAELAKNLSNAAGFDASTEQRVKVCGPRANLRAQVEIRRSSSSAGSKRSGSDRSGKVAMAAELASATAGSASGSCSGSVNVSAP